MLGFNIFSGNLDDIFKNNSFDNESDNGGDDINRYMHQNRALWRAVILQSIIDIINNSSRTENKIAKIEAKQWVFQENEDFDYVCYLAGYSTQYVRKKIMEIMRQNLVSKVVINTKSPREEKFLSLMGGSFLQNFIYEKKIQYFNFI